MSAFPRRAHSRKSLLDTKLLLLYFLPSILKRKRMFRVFRRFPFSVSSPSKATCAQARFRSPPFAHRRKARAMRLRLSKQRKHEIPKKSAAAISKRKNSAVSASVPKCNTPEAISAKKTQASKNRITATPKPKTKNAARLPPIYSPQPSEPAIIEISYSVVIPELYHIGDSFARRIL